MWRCLGTSATNMPSINLAKTDLTVVTKINAKLFLV